MINHTRVYSIHEISNLKPTRQQTNIDQLLDMWFSSIYAKGVVVDEWRRKAAGKGKEVGARHDFLRPQ